LKRPGHFAQHGADRARRRRLCPQRIRKTAHQGILAVSRKLYPEKQPGARGPRQTLGVGWGDSRGPRQPVLEKALKLSCRPWHRIQLWIHRA
jgi:hypothetical protein